MEDFHLFVGFFISSGKYQIIGKRYLCYKKIKLLSITFHFFFSRNSIDIKLNKEKRINIIKDDYKFIIILARLSHDISKKIIYKSSFFFFFFNFFLYYLLFFNFSIL